MPPPDASPPALSATVPTHPPTTRPKRAPRGATPKADGKRARAAASGKAQKRRAGTSARPKRAKAPARPSRAPRSLLAVAATSPAVDLTPPTDAPAGVSMDAEIAGWASSTPEGRRALTRLGEGYGLTFVAWYYLGLATPDCHRRWYRALDTHRRILFLAPRSHGKTQSVSRVLVLQRILANRNIRILLISLTTESARDSLSMVKADLENNADIAGDWQVDAEGGTIRSKGAWGQTSITVRRAKNLRDPTLRARGWQSAVTGGRYDLIVVDDIEDDKTVINTAQRKKTVNRIRATVVPLLDTDGQIVFIGTRKHADDAYNALKEDPTYAVIEDKAILEWPDLARVTYEVTVDESGKEVVTAARVDGFEGRSLWPEKWPVAALLMIRKSIGERAFAQEYQNEAIDDSSTAFRWTWLTAAKLRGKGMGFVREGCIDHDPLRPVPRCEGLIVYQCVDFSLVEDQQAAEEQDSDWTVVETWGLDWRTQTRTLLRLARKQGLSQGQMLGFIREEAARFPQRLAIVVENNSFGKLYEMGLRRTTDLPIFGHTTDAKKHDLYEGVPAMSSLYEGDKIILPYANGRELPAGEDDPRGLVDTFVKEHHGLGREAHDDTVMCAWIGETWIRRWILVEERRRADKTKGAGGGVARVRTI